MAWNPSPQVGAARDFAKRFGAKQVIVLYVTDGALGYASYGDTRVLCDSAKVLADTAYEAVYTRLTGHRPDEME